jgi:hypothetical protein
MCMSLYWVLADWGFFMTGITVESDGQYNAIYSTLHCRSSIEYSYAPRPAANDNNET